MGLEGYRRARSLSDPVERFAPVEYRGYATARQTRWSMRTVRSTQTEGQGLGPQHCGEGAGRKYRIAHTRWATHVPNDVTAHPHCLSRRISHTNGINALPGAERCARRDGYTFRSSTDSRQPDRIYPPDQRLLLLEASARRPSGGPAPAHAVVEKNNRDEIIAARQSSPMAIWHRSGQYLRSDAASIIEIRRIFAPCGTTGRSPLSTATSR